MRRLVIELRFLLQVVINFSGGFCAATNVYISEGRNKPLLSSLEDHVLKSSDYVKLANVFIDEPYHRSNFTLVSNNSEELVKCATSLAEAALCQIDLRQHEASHPRLGVVDHVSCHPLDSCSKSMSIAASIATDIAQYLADTVGLPGFLYGAAHPEGRRLDEIRRALGYFRPTSLHSHLWQGPLSLDAHLFADRIKPDFGPVVLSEKMGILCVGAVPWLVNFNILLETTNGAVAQRIARAASERGGGLKSVQTMALKHKDGNYEVACNILDASISPLEKVREKVKTLAEEENIRVRDWYTIGKSCEELFQLLEVQNMHAR